MNTKDITRRSLLMGAGASAAATALATNPLLAQVGQTGTAADLLAQTGITRNYALNFAPHVGLDSMNDGFFSHFTGPNVVDQIRFMNDLGFKAVEDNFMKLRPVEEQRAIARELERLGMKLATFVASFETTGPKNEILPIDSLTFASGDVDDQAALVRMIESSGEVAKRLNASWSTVLSGRMIRSLPWEYQTANVIENLKRVADVAERAGLILGLEPINSREWTGTFVTTAPHAHLIVQAVDHPNVRMIYDTYHAQIETGSILENMDLAWDSIGYIQIADAPGRNEPGSGELNYARILRHLHAKGFDGFVGLEHGHSTPGKDGVVESLRALADVNPI